MDAEADTAVGDIVDGIMASSLIDDDGRIRLSFSRVDSYRNCPLKFRFAYLDRIPTRPTPHLSFGSSIHGALERFYDQKLPECPSEDELLQFLYEAWDDAGFEDRDRDEQLAFYRHAQDVLRRFHQRVAASYRLPASTEAWFELPFDNAVVVGSIDRIDVDEDGNFHLIDYKTSRKVTDRKYVIESLQLGIYALACEHLYGKLPTTVALDFVVPGVQVTVGIEEIDLERVDDIVLATADAILDERFAPTPNRLCDWCDYKSICPAWPPNDPDALGIAVERRNRLLRTIERNQQELVELDAGIERTLSDLQTNVLNEHAGPDAS